MLRTTSHFKAISEIRQLSMLNQILILACILVGFIYLFSSSQSTVKNSEETKISNGRKISFANWNDLTDVEQRVFIPLRRRMIQLDLIPELEFIQQPTCENIFEEWLGKSTNQDEKAVPPREIPDALLKNFTLNGYVNFTTGYMDDRSGIGEVLWDNIDELVKEDIHSASFDKYNGDTRGIYAAMQSYDLDRKVGFVVGSLVPYAEVYALKRGAKQVYTMEYKKINIVGTDRILYRHPLSVAENFHSYLGKFDFAVSFSSIEHSGLGRFGDAIDPFGDLSEALKTRCMLKPNGLFFLGIPVGNDRLVFNMHRHYGRIRLALMFTGFELLGTYYKMEEIVLKERHLTKPGAKQLVFVLRKN